MIIEKSQWLAVFTSLALLITTLPATADILDNTKSLSINGVNMKYVEAGSGELTIFVHGAISDHRTWNEYVEPISEDSHFIAYTRRFYGGGPNETDANYDHAVHAEDLASLIRTVGSGPAHLITWSTGAYAATIVASKYPQLVKSMVHFEPITTSKIMDGVPHYKSASEEWDSRWGVVMEQLKAGDTRHAVRKFVEIVFELPVGGFESLPLDYQDVFLTNAYTIPIMFSGDTQVKTDCDYVSKIETPTLVVLGTQTHRAFAMEVERMAQCMPNASLHVMPGVNHAGPITGKDDFVTLIRNFVGKNR